MRWAARIPALCSWRKDSRWLAIIRVVELKANPSSRDLLRIRRAWKAPAADRNTPPKLVWRAGRRMTVAAV